MFRTIDISEVEDIKSWIRERLRKSEEVKVLASKYGYREYMIARYYEMLGSWDEVKELLNAFERRLKHSIRCNTLKVKDCRHLVERLEKLGFKLKEVDFWNLAYEVVDEVRSPTLGSTHEFLLGMYYLYRGKASLIPPLILNPQQNDKVADLAAAPGGKTTHLAQLMNNKGVILATEVGRERMRALRNNIERMGVRNTVLMRVDGRAVKYFLKGYFNKVLLDAPCTGEGLIMIDPERKIKTSFEDLMKWHESQVDFLNSAIETLNVGGYILYTTCSIAPEENELVIAKILAKRDDVQVSTLTNTPIELSQGFTEYFGLNLPKDVSRCGRIYPHIHEMEGFFLCLLEKIK
ncbi:MAG: hypothetical protein B7O98_03580 [Zestosphaera tikiterensis]|uniref:SAM-dependent MTase RsmB/NOP-type domain-containing protein n=1 Tax=Zestosphaera tikiterensis TaxID=1973259 RepID=A0A2R7Y7J9_9CREN|nr:MAG: hypothetical protein B7O98_03580 [Zestosphaera tikiterensis]